MFWFGLLSLALSVVADGPDVKYEKISGPVGHGEGPHWSDSQQALYWVDIDGGDVWRYHPESGNTTTCHLGGAVTVVIPVGGTEDTFIVGLGDGLQQLTWDGKNDSTTAIRPLGSVGPLSGNARFNDGKVDAKGRLWIGTIGSEVDNVVEENVSNLYLATCDQNSTELKFSVAVENVTVSNGIAWSADGAIMYYIDTPTRKVVAYDFDAENGAISNQRLAFDLGANNISGLPDGMTIDADDNLWIALYLGGGIIQVNPHLARLLRTFPLEGVEKVTSVAWGEKELDVLYVTTSSRDSTGGGELYKLVGTGVHGRRAHEFNIDACKKNNEDSATIDKD